MRIRAKILFALLIVAVLIATGLLPRHILGPRVVARAMTPDGFELCIVQQSSLDSLPWFATSFVSRRQGGAWQRFYFHHEDRYWFRSRFSLDTNAQVATFYRGSSPMLSFAWASGACTNLDRRHLKPEQPQQMPSGWSPPM